MKRFRLLLLVLCLIATFAGCTPLRLRQAREGLDAAVAQLPEPEGFSTVTVIVDEFDRTWDRQRCYYAQALVAIGTDLPSDEALEVYVQALRSQNWIVQPDFGVREWSEELCRGEYETVNVRTGAAGWITESDERYKQAKDQYATFVYLTLTHSLPSSAVCQ